MSRPVYTASFPGVLPASSTHLMEHFLRRFPAGGMLIQPSYCSMKDEYIARLNKAINYINANIEAPLSLEHIARKAAFSKYHFHRIFSSIVGEPLGAYIQRLRIERAASELVKNTARPITDIAMSLQY